MVTRLILLAAAVSAMAVVPLSLSAQVADTVIVTDSSRYVGQYPAGRGVLYSDSDGLFVGEFRNAVPEGAGVHFLPDGSIYAGEFSGGKHCGTGRFFSASGKVLSGEFEDDYANGLDTLWYPDGSVYVGTCRNGRPVPAGSPDYGRLYRGIHLPKHLADAKPEYSGPALTDEQLDHRILRDFEENKNRQFKNALGKLFPSKLIPVMVLLSGIDPEKKVNEVTREERQAFVRLIRHLPLTLTGLRDYREAIITKGGVSVKEVDPGTMESKLVKGLYFAGEVLDLDAVTGGFNLQIAWSTGCAAGRGIPA